MQLEDEIIPGEKNAVDGEGRVFSDGSEDTSFTGTGEGEMDADAGRHEDRVLLQTFLFSQ